MISEHKPSQKPQAPVGRVVLAAANYHELGELTRLLRMRGHHVALASEGRAGLQRAIEIAADVVLVDRDIPLLDVRTFIEVLRDNPRTHSAHVFVMGAIDPSPVRLNDAGFESLVKPFNAYEIGARIDEILRTRRGAGEQRELRGDLIDAPLFDLVQLLAAGQRTGRLHIDAGGEYGDLWLRRGTIVDAAFGAVVGEKALYRLLAVTHGQFGFLPRMESARDRIEGSTDQILLEAARRSDELTRLREQLPRPNTLLKLKFRPERLSPLASILVAHLEQGQTLSQLSDVVPGSDLEVLQGVREMLEAGALEVSDDARHHLRLCEDDETITMRAAAMRLRRPGLEGPLRLPVIAANAEAIGAFVDALASVREYGLPVEPASEIGDALFGSIGTLHLAEARLELFALPAAVALRPLWGPMLAPCTTALVLVSDEEFDDDAADLLRSCDVARIVPSEDWREPSGALTAVRSVLGHRPTNAPL